MTLSVAAGFLRTRRERLYGRVLRVFDAWEPKACLWRLSFCRLLPSSHTAGLLPRSVSRRGRACTAGTGTPFRARGYNCLMTEIRYNTRNEAVEFARRTKVNLEFIEQAKDRGERVHEVTQLALSLLGLIVFPKEQLLLDEIDSISLDDLTAEGWPKWQMTLDSGKEPTKTWVVWYGTCAMRSPTGGLNSLRTTNISRMSPFR